MTETTVTTWADGFGTWHARVTASDTIVNGHFSEVARAAIAGEIELRDDNANTDALRVELHGGRSSHDGIVEAEYVEAWPEVPQPTQDRVDVFWQLGGWSYNPATETPEQGRQRSAYTLAAAEARAKHDGITFDWSIDPDVDSSHFEDHPEPHKLYQCIAYDADGNVVGSLGGVDLGSEGGPDSDPYAEVAQAEIASEHYAVTDP